MRERHHASIMEFENLSSVKAKTRRNTPVVIRSSTWAFTFSAPASANTTGVVSEGVAPRLGFDQHGHAVHRRKRISDRHAKIRQEKLSITACR